MIVFKYDGSYNGLLTAVFDSFALKVKPDKLLTPCATDSLFADKEVDIVTDSNKFTRVRRGLEQKLTQLSPEQIFWVYLSEEEGADLILFNFLHYIFSNKRGADENMAEDSVFKVKRLSRKVFREIHRMHAFLRFNEIDNMWVALIEPECNVLPVLGEHFAERYADQAWVIADKRRKTAICYSGNQVYNINLDAKFWQGLSSLSQSTSRYDNLWRSYFKSVAIPERTNDKLQRKHIPTKYRKLLPEFHPSEPNK
jgi:probable DNA metabolism protein